LVDTGPYSAFDAVYRLLRKHFPGQQLRRVYVTHHHFDHAGAGSCWLNVGAEVVASRGDCDTICAGGVEGLPQVFRYPGYTPTKAVTPGEEVAIGRGVFKILGATGHTPGSICFAGDDYVITGDLTLGPLRGHWFTLMLELLTAFRQSRTELLDQLYSLANLRELVSRKQSYYLLPGHGDPVHQCRVGAHLKRSARIIRRIRAVKLSRT